MKFRLFSLLAAFAVLTPFAQADIQDSIADQEGPFNKLGRGISNIVFGVTEIPMTMLSFNDKHGHIAGATEGVTVGAKRAVVRIAYGLYEVLSFPVATEGGTYRSPFHSRHTIEPFSGYAEHPPELGFYERVGYARDFPSGL